MRVLFVSDTHLGFDMPSRPRVERRRRGEDFFANFERALEPARAGQVDVVVHGGDLLYRSRVPAWLAEAALAPLKRLASSGMPVLLVPGNHERAQMPYPLLALNERLHVFDRPRTFVLEARGVRAAFTGFPYARQVRQRFRELFEEASRGDTGADVRVVCLHHCVEGATCGPGNYTFRSGDDVIRMADLPGDVAAVLCGHIHRHQVLRVGGRPPVVYAGAVERTSFAEASEPKGFVLLELTGSGVGRFAFRQLPARPMIALTLSLGRLDAADACAQVAAAVNATPADAVVQIRSDGAIPPVITASFLRTIAGSRNVTLSVRRRDGPASIAAATPTLFGKFRD
jgi:DNA repair protein SbcD/Mre11